MVTVPGRSANQARPAAAATTAESEEEDADHRLYGCLAFGVSAHRDEQERLRAASKSRRRRARARAWPSQAEKASRGAPSSVSTSFTAAARSPLSSAALARASAASGPSPAGALVDAADLHQRLRARHQAVDKRSASGRRRRPRPARRRSAGREGARKLGHASGCPFRHGPEARRDRRGPGRACR